MILAFAAVVSVVVGEYTDSAVVLAIMVTSAGIGFWRERGARDAIAHLRSRLTIEAEVIRGGVPRRISAAEVVPGDVVVLSAGGLVPADGLLLEATDLHVNEAILTGETFPTEKRPGTVDAGVRSRRAPTRCSRGRTSASTGRALVVSTGTSTAFGEIAGRLRLRPPETEFDRGVRQFGIFLTSAMTVLVIAVFAVNVLLARPVVEALLFSIALAVGLSPELLPAILNVVLAQSAAALSKHGRARQEARRHREPRQHGRSLHGQDRNAHRWCGQRRRFVRLRGRPSAEVLALAVRNAGLQSGLVNPIDEALLRGVPPSPTASSPRSPTTSCASG